MSRVADSAKYYSGRTRGQIATALGVLDPNAPPDELVSEMQQEIIAELLRAFFGEKEEGGRQAGRCNSFMVIWAWGMDPHNLSHWDKRISEPLDVLLRQGYAKKAYAETREAYLAEIVGV